MHLFFESWNRAAWVVAGTHIPYGPLLSVTHWRHLPPLPGKDTTNRGFSKYKTPMRPRDHLGPYLLGPDNENQGIYTGDARELAEAIPDESVDLIFTDPVYDRTEDYGWLAETAMRVLKPDSACLAWVATPLLSKVIREMEPSLSYVWILCWLRHSARLRPGRTGITVITLCLWMEKGKSQTLKKIADLMSTGRDIANEKNPHPWNKPTSVTRTWLSAFTRPNAIVFDPFCGSGTVSVVCKMLSRRYLAFEIDPTTAKAARRRVAMTQPPLPLEIPVQHRLL